LLNAPPPAPGAVPSSDDPEPGDEPKSEPKPPGSTGTLVSTVGLCAAACPAITPASNASQNQIRQLKLAAISELIAGPRRDTSFTTIRINLGLASTGRASLQSINWADSPPLR
jgi:hypothetical protein